MRLSAPKKSTFYIALIFLVLGLVGFFGKVAFLAPYYVWFLIVSNLLLIAGCCIKDF